MWKRLKSTMKRTDTRMRSHRELEHLLSRGDDTFRDIGLTRADVIRAQKDLKFL